MSDTAPFADAVNLNIDIDRLARDLLAEIESDGWANETQSPAMFFLDHPLALAYPDHLVLRRHVNPDEMPGWVQQIVIDSTGMHSMSGFHPDQGVMPATFNPGDGVARRALTALWNAIDAQQEAGRP